MTERKRERQAAIYELEFAKQEKQIKALEREVWYRNGYADGKRDAMKWISVKERLPEDTDWYLICNRVSRVSIIIMAYYDEGKWWEFDDNGHGLLEKRNVEWWMELPEPPEVIDDGND